MVLTKRHCNLPLICQVCGDKARGMNFEVMTCMSCKAFFRRHALDPIFIPQCQQSNDCDITQLTRGNCSACRLRKCFSLGMNPKLIRHKVHCSRRALKRRRKHLLQPTPLNLLQNDASTLSNIEWNLLSNIIHAYDNGNIIEHSKDLLEHQSSLPPKIRLKTKETLDVIEYFYSTMQPFLERVPYLHDLPVDARCALMKHNFVTIGTFNSLLVIRESNAFDYTSFSIGCQNLYGFENFNLTTKFITSLEQNGTLVKIMLLITAFSTNCSIVSLDSTESVASMVSVKCLTHVQDKLVTTLWKYLTYQYGLLGAVKCFDAYVKYILNILNWTADKPVNQHSDMVDSIIEHRTQLLSIGN